MSTQKRQLNLIIATYYIAQYYYYPDLMMSRKYEQGYDFEGNKRSTFLEYYWILSPPKAWIGHIIEHLKGISHENK